jgi:hypothetical protein
VLKRLTSEVAGRPRSRTDRSPVHFRTLIATGDFRVIRFVATRPPCELAHFATAAVRQRTGLCRRGAWGWCARTVAGCLVLASCGTLAAQLPSPAPWHLQTAMEPPGEIGQLQLHRQPALRGYYQPVQVTAPAGVMVSLASEGGFGGLPPTGPLRAALLVGQPYRLQVSGLRGYEEQFLYPSIELIDRLYPPPGRGHHFPIPVALEEEDLRAALDGQMITRVIYVEDPRLGPTEEYLPGVQRVLDAQPGEDPLALADRLGKPVAVLRIGSRTPVGAESWLPPEFLFGSPQWLPISSVYQPGAAIEGELMPGGEVFEQSLWEPAPQRRPQPVFEPTEAAWPSRPIAPAANRGELRG